MTAFIEMLASEKEILVADKYKIIRRISGGSFGEVFLGENIDNGEEVAIKIETKKAHHDLMYEKNIYEMLDGGLDVGIPKIRWFGSVQNHNVLVMDRLGPSLEELFCYCSRKFTVQTVIMLADQILRRVEFVHGRCFIHRDIKPENFLMGMGRCCSKLYMIDFGLATQYRDIQTGAHVAYREGRGQAGTVRYASINAHLGIEQSRRDDLESVGYMFMYFLRGSLPWQGLFATNKKQKHEKIMEKKRSTPLEVLCEGYPVEFRTYLNYSRGLRFEETPNYMYLRELFHTLSRTMNYKCDVFDWKILLQSMQAAAQQPPTNEPNAQ